MDQPASRGDIYTAYLHKDIEEEMLAINGTLQLMMPEIFSFQLDYSIFL